MDISVDKARQSCLRLCWDLAGQLWTPAQGQLCNLSITLEGSKAAFQDLYVYNHCAVPLSSGHQSSQSNCYQYSIFYGNKPGVMALTWHLLAVRS